MRRSPVLAAFLSFVFPGLGQFYAGQTRRGVIWAIPMVIVIIGASRFSRAGQRRSPRSFRQMGRWR